MRTFFEEGDYQRYLGLLAHWSRECEVDIWAYCLMPNHVHLIAVPGSADSLADCVGAVHRRYSLFINEREGWKGYLWQGRFSSFPMDRKHLFAAVRYTELNPVRAGISQRAQDYPWSSARAHLSGKSDGVVDVQPLLNEVSDWGRFLGEAPREDALLRRHESTGRPLGSESFVGKLEALLGRPLAKQRRGPKRKAGIAGPN